MSRAWSQEHNKSSDDQCDMFRPTSDPEPGGNKGGLRIGRQIFPDVERASAAGGLIDP